MRVLDWLNKLGIVRWGYKAAVYHNAKERPIELQEPGVFNAERDLIANNQLALNKKHRTHRPYLAKPDFEWNYDDVLQRR